MDFESVQHLNLLEIVSLSHYRCCFYVKVEVAGVDTQKGMMQVLQNLIGKGHFVKLLEIEGSEI